MGCETWPALLPWAEERAGTRGNAAQAVAATRAARRARHRAAKAALTAAWEAVRALRRQRLALETCGARLTASEARALREAAMAASLTMARALRESELAAEALGQRTATGHRLSHTSPASTSEMAHPTDIDGGGCRRGHPPRGRVTQDDSRSAISSPRLR